MSWSKLIPDDAISVICIDSQGQTSILPKNVACSIAGSIALDEAATVFVTRESGEVRILKARYGVRLTEDALTDARSGNEFVYDRGVVINQR